MAASILQDKSSAAQDEEDEEGRGAIIRSGPTELDDFNTSSTHSTLLQHQEKPTNEYVLNVAFLSFLGFTTLQLFFALMARSQAMMEDCMAMYVDVVTYLFNFLAERFKHGVHRSSMKPRDIRLYRLYLELIPPFISVTTLVVVTVMALRDAIDTLIVIPPTAQEEQPDLAIMLVFSGMNLLLDFVNVACFAKADQAVGLTAGSHTIIMESVRGGYYPDEHTALLLASSSSERACGGNHHADATLTETVQTDDDNDREDAMSDDTEVEGGLNLNMCSAWTHVCADTLRSVAVLVAAGFAYVFPNLLTAANADAWGAIVVSVIILASLGPLFQGIYLTGVKIYRTWYNLDHHPHQHDSNNNSSSSKPSGIVLNV